MPIDNCFNDIRTILSYTQANVTTSLPAARTLQRIDATAVGLLDGHYAKLAPFYDPLTPRFMSAVGAVTSAIVAGTASAGTFNEFVCLLVAELNS